MPKLIEDLSTITTIPEFTLKKLEEKVKYIICHNALEALLNDDSGEGAKVDIGIGYLLLHIVGNCVTYRFVPYPTLEDMMNETLTSKVSPLSNALENALSDKIEKAYKELF